MRNTMTLMFLVGFASMSVPSVFAQEIVTANTTQPCFLNYTAGVEIWSNCGMDEDYLKASLLWAEYITGGYFSMVFISVVILATYIKYRKVVYPIVIGTAFLPISYYIFPDVFLSWSFVMAGIAIGIMMWYVYVRQTKDW